MALQGPAELKQKEQKHARWCFLEIWGTSTGCCHRHSAPPGLIHEVSREQTGPQGPAPAPPMLSFSSPSPDSRTITQDLDPSPIFGKCPMWHGSLVACENGSLGLGRAGQGASTGPLGSREHLSPSAKFSLGRACSYIIQISEELIPSCPRFHDGR